MASSTQTMPVATSNPSQWSQSGPQVQSPSSYDNQQSWNSAPYHQQWLPQDTPPPPPPGQGQGQWVWAPTQTTPRQYDEPPEAGPSRQLSTSAFQDEKHEDEQKSIHLNKPVPPLPPRNRSFEPRASASAPHLPGAYPVDPQEKASFPPTHWKEQEHSQSTSSPEMLPPPPTYTDRDAGFEVFAGERDPVPAPAQLKPLSRPMCLPQIATGFDSPFVRAHGPDAEAAGVPEEDWLAFMDALNIAMVCNVLCLFVTSNLNVLADC